jgi:hypothetical protein
MLWIGLQTHHGTAGLLPRSPAFTEYLALSPFIPSVTRFTRVGLLWMTTQWEGGTLRSIYLLCGRETVHNSRKPLLILLALTPGMNLGLPSG